MNASIINSLFAASLSLFVISMDALAASPSGPPAQQTVVLTGWLHVHDLVMSDVQLFVEVNGDTQSTQVSENGRFMLNLPADSEVKLRFEKPGHLPKEVLVDTRHADQTEAGGKTRRVKFAVVLELERHMAGFTYAGPVGSIGFDAEGGCLAVGHHQNLEDAPKRKPMVF